MKKILPFILPVLGILLLVWVYLPGDIPIKFNYGALQIDTSIQKPVLSFQNDRGEFRREFDLKLGLDLKGGTSLTFEADTTQVPSANLQDSLESARDIIERRVNMYGVSEPNVRTVKSGDIYRIVVELPGIDDPTEAVQLIGSTAQLRFRESTVSPTLSTDSAAFLFPEFETETTLTGEDIRKASVMYSQETGEPLVQLDFDGEGAQEFADITKRNVGKQVAIYLDEMLLSAPVVQQPILDGTAVITGSYTIEDAKQLAVAINSGALPLPISLVEQQSIGPTLGQMEVQASLIAGSIGLLAVAVFMVTVYGRLGLIACGALILYGLITLALFRVIPVVLTLPGIAGFILSIGMAVDANILIFERIKEELRKGRSFDAAVRDGFGRAMDAIKDANITTLLVGFILYNPLNWEFLPQFGLIRGFAVTLIIGVFVSLFTGIFITKRLINLFYKIQ